MRAKQKDGDRPFDDDEASDTDDVVDCDDDVYFAGDD